MNSFAALETYLGEVKKRWQATVASRGFGITAAAALIFTVICVAFANHFAFAKWSVISGRMLLYAAVAAVLIAVLIRPLLAMRRRGGDRAWVGRLETRFPAFEERVQTFVDQKDSQSSNPMLGLLAEDTLRVAQQAPPSEVASSGPIWTFAGLAVAALAVLIWLGVAGPGWLGYGTSRLWGGWLKPAVSNLYNIVVQPGSVTIRRKADLLITARMVGFYSPGARLFAKYASSAKWEEAPMQRRLDDTGFEFLFAGVDEGLHYYIAAGGVKSAEYEVRVVELANIKKLRLTYHYPSWTGLAVSTEDPGGDVRAVAGTEVDVDVETDRPLAAGVLRLDGATNMPLRANGNVSRGRLAVEKDGRYFVAALYNGEIVRLSDDFFIEATPDQPPTIKITRPGRDHRATSIEEVTAQIKAEDDFGLKDLELHYSVNGSDEKTVKLTAGGHKESAGAHTFMLENFSLVPGDVVSYYAVARDAKVETKTDIFFIEVQPFEREFFQSQQMGGGGGGGDNESSQISRRQKEIVSATWNLARERKLDKQKAADHAKTLSGIQSKLRDQARTLAERVKARQLGAANNDFKAFVQSMEKAAEAMGPAVDKLGAQKWEDALPPEQKALQNLLRAESIFRQIQVAFGNQGGGGGGGMGRDLAEMFDLELDLEKNQYETGQQASAQERDRQLDQAMEKLRELARRQEQLAEQQRRQQTPTFDQRWQQEMLRREAEDLKKQLEKLEQQASNQNQGQSSRSQQQGSQSSQSSSSGTQRSTLERAQDRLQQATRDMEASTRQPSSGQPGSENERRLAQMRAQERLREAEELLTNERRQRAGEELEDMERRAADLAGRQEALANKLRESLRQAAENQQQPTIGRDPLTGRPTLQPGGVSGPSREQAQAMARDKEQMLAQLEALEKRMQDAARRMASTQPKAANQLRETLNNMQQNELPSRLRYAADLLKRGMGLFAAQREEPVTRALNQLRDGVRETRRLAQNGQQGGEQNLDRALSRVERLRQQLEQAMAARRGQQQGRQGQQGQQDQQGQQSQGQGQQRAQQGQPGQQGQGQQQGQQGQQGQAGQQGQPQAGQQGQRGGTPFGIHGGGDRWGDASNRGDWIPPLPGQLVDPTRAFREGYAELSEIERGLRGDPELAREVEELRKEMRALPMSRFPGNPALLTREQQKLLHEAEQLELMIRRKLEEKQGAQVRANTEQPVPEDYRKAVAEYFRRLSKEK